MASKPEITNDLPKVHRFITTHDPTTKKAIFSDAVPEEAKVDHIPGADFRLGYVTKGFPVDLNKDSLFRLWCRVGR